MANQVVLSVELLHSVYNELNQKVYNNSLPNIQLKLNRTTKSLGVCCSKIRREPLTGRLLIIPQYIGISVNYQYTLDELTNIMLHEMIHYDIHLTNKYWNKYNDHHGYDFIIRMNKVNKMGYNVDIRSEKTCAKTKQYMIIVSQEKNGTFYYHSVNPTSPKVNEYIKTIKRLYSPSVLYSVVVDSTEVGNGYRHQSTFRGRYYSLASSKMGQLIQNNIKEYYEL